MTRHAGVWPDAGGRFGRFGGIYVPETLMGTLLEVAEAYEEARRDSTFQAKVSLLKHYVGRPSATRSRRATDGALRRTRIFLKREDLLHTGAHKINNALGQMLLAKRMGKHRIIAETGAGQHGVATATVARAVRHGVRRLHGRVDMRRQALNVYRMRFLGAEVRARRLRHADAEGRDQRSDARLGHERAHHPLHSRHRPRRASVPDDGARFPGVIGREARAQILEQEGRLPDCLIACVGGGSNAIGLFHAFLGDAGVRMVGVEAGGRPRAPASTRRDSCGAGLRRAVGVLQGTRTYVLQDDAGNVLPTHSVSAGLDYPAVGPEHAFLHDEGRVEYASVTDDEALAAFHFWASPRASCRPSSRPRGGLARPRSRLAPWPDGDRQHERPRRQGPGDTRVGGRGTRGPAPTEGTGDEADERQGEQPVRAGRGLLAGSAAAQNVYVAGTTATGRTGSSWAGDAYAQGIQCFKNVEKALHEAGANFRDVVRTRMYVTDIARWEAVGRAHGQIFRDIRPAATMVEVSRLVDPDMLVEIEVEAVVGEDTTQRLPKKGP